MAAKTRLEHQARLTGGYSQLYNIPQFIVNGIFLSVDEVNDDEPIAAGQIFFAETDTHGTNGEDFLWVDPDTDVLNLAGDFLVDAIDSLENEDQKRAFAENLYLEMLDSFYNANLRVDSNWVSVDKYKIHRNMAFTPLIAKI